MVKVKSEESKQSWYMSEKMPMIINHSVSASQTESIFIIPDIDRILQCHRTTFPNSTFVTLSIQNCLLKHVRLVTSFNPAKLER